MKLSYMDQPIRAKKDSKPYLAGGRIWKQVEFVLNGTEKQGLVSTHWLYFEHEDQWYKLNCQLYHVELRDLELKTRQVSQQTLDEKRARRQERRKERRARIKAALELAASLENQEEDTEG